MEMVREAQANSSGRRIFKQDTEIRSTDRELDSRAIVTTVVKSYPASSLLSRANFAQDVAVTFKFAAEVFILLL